MVSMRNKKIIIKYSLLSRVLLVLLVPFDSGQVINFCLLVHRQAGSAKEMTQEYFLMSVLLFIIIV